MIPNEQVQIAMSTSKGARDDVMVEALAVHALHYSFE